MSVYKLIIIKSAFLCYKTTDQISEELRYCFKINVHRIDRMCFLWIYDMPMRRSSLKQQLRSK